MPNELNNIHRRHQLLQEAMKALATATQASIDVLDLLVADPDIEESEADESDGTDLGDTSAPEWISLGRHKGQPHTPPLPPEDAEDDDQDQCLASDDDPTRRVGDGLPGDAADTEPNGDEGDYSDGDCGLVLLCGVDQSRPIGPKNPAQF